MLLHTGPMVHTGSIVHGKLATAIRVRPMTHVLNLNLPEATILQRSKKIPLIQCASASTNRLTQVYPPLPREEFRGAEIL
jgi:hypothetical protein